MPIQVFATTSILQALACLLIVTGTVVGARKPCKMTQSGCNNSDVIIKCPHFPADQSNLISLYWRVRNRTTRSSKTMAYMTANGKIIYYTKNTVLDGRLTVYPNGSLEVKSLVPEDAETSYEYHVRTKTNPIPQRCIISLQVKCNGEVSNFSQDVCVEDEVVLDCPAKHRTNPRVFKELRWLKETSGMLKLVASLSSTRVRINEEGVLLHGNGSLVLPRGRAIGKDTYKCFVHKIGKGRRREIHEVGLNNSKCHKTGGNVKTTQGRITMTTTAKTIQSTGVVMSNAPTPSVSTEAVSPSVTAMVCGGVLNNSVGTFQSPNFPSTYPANSHCEWTISLPQDYAAINITLNQVNLEGEEKCRHDYIAIYDELHNQIGCRSCGTHNSPLEVQVRGRIAVIVFESDSSVNKSGFLARYKGALNVSNRNL
ncbi:uncharacterized protein LOC116291239 [Actinia tenebrosa]|uniref:Uncharacterized protein LOC116291239 n=1 Tax=Actinia tenebrosa TaxID=6105 RepID=A0A6P8HET3_ACTTE|nr:uncharacterized protein LOC116291239 [Actinia tenebrosa]